MESSEEKKTKLGRKEDPDSKVRVVLWVRPSIIKKNKGEDKMKDKIYKHIKQKD